MLQRKERQKDKQKGTPTIKFPYVTEEIIVEMFAHQPSRFL